MKVRKVTKSNKKFVMKVRKVTKSNKKFVIKVTKVRKKLTKVKTGEIFWSPQKCTFKTEFGCKRDIVDTSRHA